MVPHHNCIIQVSVPMCNHLAVLDMHYLFIKFHIKVCHSSSSLSSCGATALCEPWPPVLFASTGLYPEPFLFESLSLLEQMVLSAHNIPCQTENKLKSGYSISACLSAFAGKLFVSLRKNDFLVWCDCPTSGLINLQVGIQRGIQGSQYSLF